MKQKILISTGGSGGHIIPAEIINDHLKYKFDVVISTDLRGYKFINKDLGKILIIDTPKLIFDFFIVFRLFKIFYLTLKTYFYLLQKLSHLSLLLFRFYV